MRTYKQLSIDTLITDVQKLLTEKDWLNEELARDLGGRISGNLQEQFGSTPRMGGLRLSRMGPICPRALWYSVHEPERAEPLPPWAENKFAFGTIIEAWAITLAKAAGHRVEGEQDVVYVDGIAGHRDCIIDGCIVDIKSCSSRSFAKFKDGSLALDDSFGYLDQLDGYLVGSLEDPLVVVKDKGYLWPIHKEKGHMCLYEHTLRQAHILHRIADSKRIVIRDTPPECRCGEVPDGQSGNIRLDYRASYSSFKWSCKPTLRCFLYADGPRYFTKVVKRPMNKNGPIIEIDREGKVVYN